MSNEVPKVRLRVGPDDALPAFSGPLVVEEADSARRPGFAGRAWAVALNIAWWTDILSLIFTLNPEPLIRDNWMINFFRRRR